MNDGLPFLAVAGLAISGLLWLTAYLYGLYRLARRFGARFRSLRHPWLPYAAVLALSVACACLAFFVHTDAFTRFGLAAVVFMAHGHPLTVGLWRGQEAARREDHRVWRERTEEWLSDWEESRRE